MLPEPLADASLQDAAREYCRQGFAPIPVPAGMKSPAVQGWQQLRITEDAVPRHFRAAAGNIGLLCGEPSGNYVDVDLDTLEAAFIAGLFLPPTPMIHGRGGKPASHWGYRVPAPITSLRFRDVDDGDGGKGTVLVELWTGYRKAPDGSFLQSARHIVVPPSTHEGTGDAIEWEPRCRPEPAVIEGTVLTQAVEQAAAAVILARHWPNRGSRQDCALALSGWLLRAGIPTETVELLIKAICLAANDEEETRRVPCVYATAQKLRGGETTTGAPTLAGLLSGNGAQVIDRVGQWLHVAPDVHSVAFDFHAGARRRDQSDRSDRSGSVPWPMPPAAAAYAGLAGRIVRLIDQHTEADRAAVLVHLLAGFGNAIGPGPHTVVGATRHTARENFIVVGRSAKARKGEAWTHTRHLLRMADEDWFSACVSGGLSTGEGLIWAVRDAVHRTEAKRGGDGKGDRDLVVVDEGVMDKRLLVVEPEFARVLRAMSREKNTLSAVIRDSWDSGDLRTMTRTDPAKATGAHISIIGHITVEELRRELGDTEMVNGFANRFIWIVVRRNKSLPEPPPLVGREVEEVAQELGETIRWASAVAGVARDDAAREQWYEMYERLVEERDGLEGALLARSEAHVLRLSLIYALLDRSRLVRPSHLDSAIALWEYAERSVQYIFGESSGNPTADTLYAAIQEHGERTRSQIRDLFSRHEPEWRIVQALTMLKEAGKIRCETRPTGGRPVEVWSLTE